MKSPDGKMRETDCAGVKGLFRIIQSIPSPKAKPFKQWLVKVGNYSEIPNSSNSCDDNIAGEWIEAFRGGPASKGNVSNARALSELFCLGAVALRLGRKIEWDSPAMKVTNIPEANDLLHRNYRQGWEL